MTNRFPLLRLPQDAHKSVLRSMEPLKLIFLSFSSNRAKSLVASINMKSQVTATISNILTINATVVEQLFQFQFYYHEVENGVIPIKMATPGIVYFIYTIKGEAIRYVIPKVMDIPSWFSHIKAIFNCSKIVRLHFFGDVGNFDLDSIRDSMVQENIHELIVSNRSSDEYNRKIMKTFPYMKNLSLWPTAYENGKPPGEVLIQNFCKFHIGIFFHRRNPTTMKLDDILMMNSKHVSFDFSELTEKDANRFLKLWMRGNSKLQFFCLRFANRIGVDTVLKGITFQEVPLEVKRFFIGFKDPIKGGIDIIRRDGTRGTITFNYGYMRFFVWHDYCKVEK